MLKNIASIYTGTKFRDGRGIEYFLRTQQKWKSRMLVEWDSRISMFIIELRSAIGREPLKGKPTTESQMWRQPLKMPKLHCLAAHCTQFVLEYGYLGAFTEQLFEHLQQVSRKIRESKSHSKCAGAHICDDLQYAWISSSPLLLKAWQDAEVRRASISKSIKKRKFTTYSAE